MIPDHLLPVAIALGFMLGGAFVGWIVLLLIAFSDRKTPPHKDPPKCN